MGNRLDIRLDRMMKMEECTIGVLTYGGRTCLTLEPRHRDYENGEMKVYGESAIPHGAYKLKKYWSAKNKRFVPLLQDVPMFEGIEIHIGNYKKDTKGCILVGTDMITQNNSKDASLTGSAIAFRNLMTYLDIVWNEGSEVFININENNMRTLK